MYSTKWATWYQLWTLLMMSMLTYCDNWITVVGGVVSRQDCICMHSRHARALSILSAQVDSVSKTNSLNLETFGVFTGCYSVARIHSVLWQITRNSSICFHGTVKLSEHLFHLSAGFSVASLLFNPQVPRKERHLSMLPFLSHSSHLPSPPPPPPAEVWILFRRELLIWDLGFLFVWYLGLQVYLRSFVCLLQSDPSSGLVSELGTCSAHACRGQGRILVVFLYHIPFYSFKEGFLIKPKAYPVRLHGKSSLAG